MKLSVFNPNIQGPHDKHFTGGMQDAILNNAPSTSFGSLTAILVPYVGRPIYEVTLMVASSGEIEGQQQSVGFRSVKTPKAPELVKTRSRWWECKCGMIYWQQELTEIKLIAQCSHRAMEATETGAAFYQVWEAHTTRDLGGSVRRLHGTRGCSFQWCPFPLWIEFRPRCPPEEPKQGPEALSRTCNSLVTS